VVIRRAHLDRIAGVASSLAVAALCAVAVHGAVAGPKAAPAALAAHASSTVVVPNPGGDTGWG
jgi:hypothetical protein